MRWTKRLPKKERKELAEGIKDHREWQLMHHQLGYSAARRLEHIALGFDLEGVVRNRIASSKRPVRFFDSGAGHAGVSGDLKRKFGDKVEVTALTLLHPNVSAKSKRRAIKDAKENPRAYYPYSASEPKLKEIGEKFAKDHRKILDIARKNAKVVDDVKVGLLENMPVKTKYDIIFDHSGPLQYSKHLERVAEQYEKMLPKGGLLITNMNSAVKITHIKPKLFRAASQAKDHVVLEKV